MRNKASLVGLIVVATLGFSQSSMAIESLDTGGTIINFGSTETKLSQVLSEKYRMKLFSAYEDEETTAQVKANVADADLVYVNLEQFYGEELRLNKYLSEAVKQKKLIVLENARSNNKVSLSALPFSVNAEVILYKPEYYTNTHSDKVLLFGSTKATSQQSAKTVAVGHLSDMDDEELSNALGKVKAAIEELKSVDVLNADELVSVLSPGTPTYDCPAEALAEQLCRNVYVHTRAYRPPGDTGISSLSHYFIGMYRMQGRTTVYVTTFGSINISNMEQDHAQERGYFLKDFTVTVETAPNNLNHPRADLFQSLRLPDNENDKTSIKTTQGLTFEITAGIDGEDVWDLGGKFGYNQTNSRTMTLNDWGTQVNSDSDNVVWNMSLSKYKTPHDWVKRGLLWRPIGFQEVPSMSKGGFQYATESVWQGAEDVTGIFPVEISTRFTNTFLWWAGYNNPAYSDLIHEHEHGKFELDLGWLKTNPDS